MVQKKKKNVFYVHSGHFAVLVEQTLFPGLLSHNHRCAFFSVLLDFPTFIPAPLLTGTGLCILLRCAGLASEILLLRQTQREFFPDVRKTAGLKHPAMSATSSGRECLAWAIAGETGPMVRA